MNIYSWQWISCSFTTLVLSRIADPGGVYLDPDPTYEKKKGFGSDRKDPGSGSDTRKIIFELYFLAAFCTIIIAVTYFQQFITKKFCRLKSSRQHFYQLWHNFLHFISGLRIQLGFTRIRIQPLKKTGCRSDRKKPRIWIRLSKNNF